MNIIFKEMYFWSAVVLTPVRIASKGRLSCFMFVKEHQVPALNPFISVHSTDLYNLLNQIHR